MDDQQLFDDIRTVLRRLGPTGPAELADRLAEHGHDIGERALRDLLLADREGFEPLPLPDGRFADLDHLLDGLVVSHRISDAERRAEEVAAAPDLVVVQFLAPDGRHVPIAAGGTLELTAEDGFAGPPGWLPDDPILTLTIRDGAVEVAGAPDVPGPDRAVAGRLAAAHEAVAARAAWNFDAGDVLVAARARYPLLLADPQAPVSELLELAGVELTDRAAGGDATDERVRHLSEDHGFDEQTVADLTAVERSVTGMLGELEAEVPTGIHGDEPPDGSLGELRSGVDVDGRDALARLLADQGATIAVLHDVVLDGVFVAAGVLALLDAADGQPDTPGARANAHWLRGRLLEFVADDHRDAETELSQALDADPDHGEAIFDLARYRADRGEARAALGLLRRLDRDGVDDRWLELLERYAQPGPADAGRNDPCPCGSGRKHKVCCGPRRGWPLDERRAWLWDKIWRNATMPHAIGLIDDVAAPAGLDSLDQVLDDPVLMNLACFEGGLVEEFTTTRGALVPADELERLHELEEVRGRACEVAAVDPGESAEVLDLTTGERLALDDVSLSRSVDEGDVLLLWIVPGPDGPEAWAGGLHVPSGALDRLLDVLDDDQPGAGPLAGWYAGLSAPPRMENTEGEALVLTTLTFDVPDGDEARRLLAGELEREEPDDGTDPDATARFSEVVGDDERTIRGTVIVDGDTVVIQANSTVRAERLRDLLAELVPEAELVDAERIPAGELTAPAGEAAGGGPAGAADLDEDQQAQLTEQLDEWMADYEERWVDTPLPALDGTTPREAADDPTRRGELDRLLREMASAAPAAGPGRTMDADRVRRLLGM